MTIHHRPLYDEMPRIKETLGITLLVSILGEDERPEEIKQQCELNNIKHRWINLKDANNTTLKDPEKCAKIKEDLKQLYHQMATRREKVMLHCGAGIHRSGIIGYALIRKTGLNINQAFDVLR